MNGVIPGVTPSQSSSSTSDSGLAALITQIASIATGVDEAETNIQNISGRLDTQNAVINTKASQNDVTNLQASMAANPVTHRAIITTANGDMTVGMRDYGNFQEWYVGYSNPTINGQGISLDESKATVISYSVKEQSPAGWIESATTSASTAGMPITLRGEYINTRVGSNFSAAGIWFDSNHIPASLTLGTVATGLSITPLFPSPKSPTLNSMYAGNFYLN